MHRCPYQSTPQTNTVQTTFPLLMIISDDSCIWQKKFFADVFYLLNLRWEQLWHLYLSYFSLWAVVQWQFKLKSFITDYVFKQTKHMGAPLNSVKRSCFPSWLEKTNLIVSFIFFLLIFVNVHISVHTLSDLMQDTH